MGGYFDFTRTSGRGDATTDYNTSVLARYFLIDRLSLGAAFGLDAGSNVDTVASFGPSASYFFLADEKTASYVALSLRKGLTDSTVNFSLVSELGFEYFLTPSVAIGPAFFFTHYFSKYDDYQRYGLALNFGLYL